VAYYKLRRLSKKLIQDSNSMHKIYKHSGVRFYFASLFLVFVLVMFPMGLLRDAIASGGILYIGFSVLFSLLFIYALFVIWQNLTMKIVVSDGGFSINKQFESIDIRWDEIVEFGKYRRGSAYNPGYWWFYFKLNKSVDNKINIGILDFKEKDELISTVFNKAPNAKFITLENTSWIPFVKRLKALQWNQNERL
jgi:hypothetical protein